MIKSKLLVLFIVGMAVCLPASAKTYKWVDDKGVTHYGETIPPEYANKNNVELDKGRTVKKTDILTPEERRANEAVEARKRVDEEAVLELKRRDKALVNTYSNEQEIDLARSRNLQQVDARVNSINSQIKLAKDNLLGLQKEADGLNKAGKKIPPSLHEDMQVLQSRLTKLQQDQEKVTSEKAALEARYDADKARYKELTGK